MGLHFSPPSASLLSLHTTMGKGRKGMQKNCGPFVLQSFKISCGFVNHLTYIQLFFLASLSFQENESDFVAVAYNNTTKCFFGKIVEESSGIARVRFLTQGATGDDFVWPEGQEPETLESEQIFQRNIKAVPNRRRPNYFNFPDKKEIEQKFKICGERLMSEKRKDVTIEL